MEIQRAGWAEPFPDHVTFSALVSEVEGLPETWRAVLAATRGVYVLVDPEDGELYVGSATGVTVFLGGGPATPETGTAATSSSATVGDATTNSVS